MEYYVYKYNINRQEMERINIFSHMGFNRAVLALLQEDLDKAQFADKLQKELAYCFKSKSEYEIAITSSPCYTSIEKVNKSISEYEEHKNKYGHYPKVLYFEPLVVSQIDIYDQIVNNIHIFIDYVWSFKEEFNEHR